MADCHIDSELGGYEVSTALPPQPRPTLGADDSGSTRAGRSLPAGGAAGAGSAAGGRAGREAGEQPRDRGMRLGLRWISHRHLDSHWPRHITLSEARSRLYQHRFWPPNSHFAAFFKIYKICTLLHRSELNFLEKIVQNFQKVTKKFSKLINFFKFCKKK